MDDISPWLDWLRRHSGEIQFSGKPAGPFVHACFSHTTYGNNFELTPPCCAATLCAALEETGYNSTRSAAALSYATYGKACELKPGAIVVFHFADRSHHVSVCDHIVSDNLVACTGGNQHHELGTAIFLRSRIIATRWPVNKKS